MHPHIKNILENYTYPTIKSIAYPNGDMLVLQGQWLGEEYHLRILCQSTLDSYFKYNEADYVSDMWMHIYLSIFNYYCLVKIKKA